jgi:acyl carrier protein
LENLIKNPSLADLIGGIQYVTLSDEEAKRRGTQKSILERKAYPAFEIVIEINNPNSWTIHENVKDSVDLLLRDNFMLSQVRHFSLTETIKLKCQKFQNSSVKRRNNVNEFANVNYKNWILINQPKALMIESKKLVIYPYSLSNNLLKEVLLKMGVKFVLTNDIRKANLIIGLRKHLKQNLKLKIYSIYQLKRILLFINYRKNLIMSENLLRLQIIIGEQLGIEPSKVKPNANFTKELGADSLDVIELVLKIEYDFDINIEDQYASKIETLQGALNYIENLENSL